MNNEEYKRKAGDWLNPTEELLWSKLMELKDTLDILEKQQLQPIKEEILRKCKERIECARTSVDPMWKGFPWLPILKKNHNLFWCLVHRTMEDIVLLVPDSEVLSKAEEVKDLFSLNIKEENVRTGWLGGDSQKGKLIEVLEELRANKDMEKNRHIIKAALRIVNTHIDRSFGKLSLNYMMSVSSGILLGISMLFFFLFNLSSQLEEGFPTVAVIALLGLMGAYLSNLMTKEEFLFVRGPFWRFVSHHIVSKPILSSFAAVFIHLLEKSKLIFSVTNTSPAQFITLNISEETIGYAYAILAIVSGFSAEKLLRGMIDKVLRRLEEATPKEKTKETKETSG